MKKRNCTICLAKTKALISCAVTAQLICGFVFAHAKVWFSHEVTQMICTHTLEIATTPGQKPKDRLFQDHAHTYDEEREIFYIFEGMDF